jgi:hypothetical protein
MPVTRYEPMAPTYSPTSSATPMAPQDPRQSREFNSVMAAGTDEAKKGSDKYAYLNPATLMSGKEGPVDASNILGGKDPINASNILNTSSEDDEPEEGDE